MTEEILMIGKNEYSVKRTELRQAELRFYPENPRVYSSLRNADSEEPSQEEIEECMKQMEHVKQLKLSIESNGGLIDPLIVRDGDNVVLEGNSRLAAYRILNKLDPIKWGLVKCLILPADISDSAVFTLLGQYHIVGRKDWSPFEQAGYLYRRMQATKYPVEAMANELGITAGSAKSYIEVYSFMVNHNEVTPERWSYFEEYLKNRNIKAARSNNPEMDNRVVEMVKTGSIEKAQDMRKLGDIIAIDTEASKKAVTEVMTGSSTLNEVFEELSSDKQIADIKKKINKFRTEISRNDVVTKILDSDEEMRESVLFDLKKIRQRIDNIINKVEQ